MSSLTHQKRLSKFKRSISEANKIALLFQYFWNMIFDKNPIYCFSCGKYIPAHQRNSEFMKTPYKNKLIHNFCWDALPSDDFVKRLNEESLLICHLDLGWGVHGSVCRKRVKNNPFSIMVHMINHHDCRIIPELKENEVVDSLVLPNPKNRTERLDKLQKVADEYKKNPIEWFLDNQWTFESIRNIHFLKPNGRSFPKVREY